jgi:hypothetical protein
MKEAKSNVKGQFKFLRPIYHHVQESTLKPTNNRPDPATHAAHRSRHSTVSHPTVDNATVHHLLQTRLLDHHWL